MELNVGTNKFVEVVVRRSFNKRFDARENG